MSDNESKELKKIYKSNDRYMNKVGKEEKKRAERLKNCKSKLQFQFAQNFAKETKRQGIKGKMAKDILDISAPDLSEYKNGKLDVKLEKLEDIANRLNVSPFYLLGITDNPKKMPIVLSSMIYGLTLEARYSLIKLYYGKQEDYNEIEAEIVDDETGEIDINVLPNGSRYNENFEILSSIIADFPNFCSFFTYIRRYVEVKQEIEKLNTNDNNSNTSQIKKLKDDLEIIKEKIQNSVFNSLDKIVDKKKEGDNEK